MSAGSWSAAKFWAGGWVGEKWERKIGRLVISRIYILFIFYLNIKKERNIKDLYIIYILFI